MSVSEANVETERVPPGYSYAATAILFLLGGLVTAVFSGSLVKIAKHADFPEVLLTGMVIPTFTWAVQLTASGLLLSAPARRLYWGDLGRICLLGSFALLPAGILNLVAPGSSWWWSSGNVLLSVVIMAADLFRRCAGHGIPWGWPASWCATISVNMTLFYLASRHWW